MTIDGNARDYSDIHSRLAAYCQNATAPRSPTTSTNGITGTWSPATINTATAGTVTYTFTPDAGQCAIHGYYDY